MLTEKTIQIHYTPGKFLLLIIFLLSISHCLTGQTEGNPAKASSCLTELGLVKVDLCDHSFSFPAKVNMSRGLIEVVLCTPLGKKHESVFVTTINPVTFEAALNLIGCVTTEPYGSFIQNPEHVLKIKHKKKRPDRVELWVEYTDSLGIKKERIETFIWDEKNKRTLDPVNWHFKGILRDEKGNPMPYFGNNLVVTYLEVDSILEMDSPMLFNDDYYFANKQKSNFYPNKDVTIYVKQVQ